MSWEYIWWRIRYEPALILGAVASLLDLVANGGSWRSAIPVVTALLIRQLVVPAHEVELEDERETTLEWDEDWLR
jgi:hypothetical protein